MNEILSQRLCDVLDFLTMSTRTPRELAELTVTRLNRASSDLGLTLRGGPLFELLSYHIESDPELGIEAEEVFDIELTVTEFEDYSRLATMLEKLAFEMGAHKHNQRFLRDAFLGGTRDANPNQGQLFDPADNDRGSLKS